MGKELPLLILASGSPRRAELLRRSAVPFEVVVPKIAEVWGEAGNDPCSLAQDIALEKALSVSRARPNRIVVGADTLVVCGKEMFGKPKTEAEAAQMLEKLSGRDHLVVTGVALSRMENGKLESMKECERTIVSFKRLSEEEIRAYVATGEPLDKAGGYAIQGVGAFLVEKVAGCYFNVVGLPLSRLYEMLRRWGCDLLG